MEDEIIVNGIVYVVKKQNEGYVVMKKENGNLVEPSAEELKNVLEELSKLKDENKLENFKKKLKEMIASGKIKDFESLKNFITSCDLTNEEKEALLNGGIGELDLQKIIDLKNQILDSLNNDKKDNLKAIISFNVKDNPMGDRYCEIKLGYRENDNTIIHISQVMNYNDTLKKELIEPIALDVALRGKVESAVATKSDDVVNNRGNFRLISASDIYLGINNTEYDYAQELETKCNNVKDKNIENAEARGDEANSLQSNGENEEEKYTIDEYGNALNENGEIIGRIGENGKLIKDNGKPRMLKPKDGNGFTISLFIALTSLISSLLIILQVIFFSKI